MIRIPSGDHLWVYVVYLEESPHRALEAVVERTCGDEGVSTDIEDNFMTTREFHGKPERGASPPLVQTCYSCL